MIFLLNKSQFLVNSVIVVKVKIISTGLRLWSKVCSEHVNDWQYLTLRDLEENEVLPKGES